MYVSVFEPRDQKWIVHNPVSIYANWSTSLSHNKKAFKALKLSYCRSDHKINIFVVSFISFFATKLCGPSSLKGETAGANCQLNTDIGLP